MALSFSASNVEEEFYLINYIIHKAHKMKAKISRNAVVCSSKKQKFLLRGVYKEQCQKQPQSLS